MVSPDQQDLAQLAALGIDRLMAREETAMSDPWPVWREIRESGRVVVARRRRLDYQIRRRQGAVS